MKKGITLLTLVVSLFFGLEVMQAQSGLKKANNEYENLAYSESIKIYQEVANKGFVNSELVKKLGDSFYFNGDYTSAFKWYTKLFTDFDSDDIEAVYAFRFAQTLKNVEEYDSAQVYLNRYAKQIQNNLQRQMVQLNLDSEIDQNSGRYIIKRLEINSPYSDYPNSVHDDKLYFTSARDTGNFTKRVFTWTGDAFTKLYTSSINEDGALGGPIKLSSKIDSKFNESGSVLTNDGNTLYFTRNNFLDGKRGINDKKITLLKIYRAELKDGKWTNVTELPFNSDQFSTAHPVLNVTEDVLYFVSDRPGGFGSSDIWKVKIIGTGFGKPENLGPMINTIGRESFPYVTVNNELYFSSDTRNGLGGLDVYVTKLKEDGSFTEVQNVGTPINSRFDDFAFIINSKTKHGFFASNRKGGVGKDDIFSFIETRSLEFECVQKLVVTVIESKTGNIITDPGLQLYNSNNTFNSKSLPFDSCNQTFDTKFDCGETYIVKFNQDGYIPQEVLVRLPNVSGVTELTIVAESVEEEPEFEKGDDLYKELNLLPIHFDFDKSNIRPDAAIELNKIVEAMKEYPNMKIDVRSFTDSRGSSAYNMKLSDRRAKSTAEWIISQGIASNRVSYRGYGDTQLLNGCSKGVKCTDAQHEENRRSEFIVTEI